MIQKKLNDNNYCIYRHIKPCGETFYIGIGNKRRPYKKSDRNKYWHNVVNKYGYEIQVLKSDLSWEDAKELEIVLISYYGRKDLKTGCLVNMTEGGNGTLGFTRVLPQEQKNKISLSLSKKVICTLTNKEWISATECAKDNNINRSTLINQLSGHKKNHTTFKYKYGTDKNK